MFDFIVICIYSYTQGVINMDKETYNLALSNALLDTNNADQLAKELAEQDVRVSLRMLMQTHNLNDKQTLKFVKDVLQEN